jgi:hypothetical protein
LRSRRKLEREIKRDLLPDPLEDVLLVGGEQRAAEPLRHLVVVTNGRVKVLNKEGIMSEGCSKV